MADPTTTIDDLEYWALMNDVFRLRLTYRHVWTLTFYRQGVQHKVMDARLLGAVRRMQEAVHHPTNTEGK